MNSNFTAIEATPAIDLENEVVEQIEKSVKPIRRLIRFASSSFTCTLLDQAIAWSLFSLFLSLGMTNDFIRITLASVIARMASVSLNFQINSHLVFAKGNSGSARRAFWRFMALAACVLSLSCLGVWFCHEFMGIPDYIAKVGVDFCLFFLTYNVQRKYIFVERPALPRAKALA